MSARIEGLIFIAVMLALSFLFQLQAKLFADQIAPLLSRPAASFGSIIGALARELIAWRPFFIGLLGTLILTTWLLALTRLELSFALPVAALGIVINTVGSSLLLGETMSTERLVGTGFVALGLYFVLRS